MKTITIEVTQEDIDKGIRHSAFCCPVAIAADRAGLRRPAVTGSHIYVACCEIPELGRELPDKAADFIYDFDRGLPVKPFSFEIPAA